MIRGDDQGSARCASDDGASLIEFSVVLGLLLYLIFGAISFGVVLAHSHAYNEAAGEAARAAAIGWDDGETPEDERIDLALASLASSDLDCDPAGPLRCTVTLDACVGDASFDCATVEIEHDRNEDPLVGRLPIIDAVLPETISARATAMVGP